MRAPADQPGAQPPAVQLEVVTEATEHALELLARGHGHIVLIAPAGYGKSSALRQLERAGHSVGLRLQRYAVGEARDRHDRHDRPDRPDRHDHPDVVVVDDAHLLPADGLQRLTAMAQAGTRVLAAATPPPGGSFGPGLGPLVEGGDVVGLEPWLVDEVESLLLLREDDAWATLDAETVVRLTGGLPWLVTKMLDDPGSAGRPPRPGQPTGPERQVLRTVDRLPARVGEVLMALCAGYPVDRGPRPAPLRDLDAAQLRDLLDRLYDAGVLTRDGHVPPLIRRAVLLHVPRHRIRPHLSESLLDDLTAADVDLGPIAAELAGAGLRDPRLAAALEARGEARLEADPAEAASLLLAAAQCGGEGSRLAVRRAEALAMSGELGASSAALNSLPDGPGSGGGGLRVAATVAVLSGQLHDAAALCRWAVGHEGLLQAAGATSVAAYVLYGDGERQQADSLLAAEQRDRPALTGSPMRAMAAAVRSSFGPDPSAALSTLVQASRASLGRRDLLPDQPASLGALVALHGGDLAMAESLLCAAMTHQHELLPADRSRTVALRAWTSMQAGQYAEAHAHLADLEPASPRDEPWMWGLRVGLARRQDDVRALARLWVDARGVLVGHPVDLYSLLPLGEIGLAAARMGESELVEPLWGRAMDLLDRLGMPPLWAPAFHWYGVQAAILTNRPQAMAPHAAVLVAAARTSPFATALAQAGRAWIAVLGHHVEPAQVELAARGLASVGQRWEGARLAGHAAARAADRKDTAALLECARDLLASTTSPDPGHTGQPEAAVSERRAGAVPLSRREREVVELVLAGMTYRQVGETLYLSAKTVEHHIARIKRRSGVSTRSELLSRLSISVR